MRNLWISYKNISGIDSRASVLIAPIIELKSKRDIGVRDHSVLMFPHGIEMGLKPGRRCGRGRHGRPWPCEWDVGHEPDRDERSEPPTAIPPPGAIQTMKTYDAKS